MKKIQNHDVFAAWDIDVDILHVGLVIGLRIVTIYAN
jgi:hypothetical protein